MRPLNEQYARNHHRVIAIIAILAVDFFWIGRYDVFIV